MIGTRRPEILSGSEHIYLFRISFTAIGISITGSRRFSYTDSEVGVVETSDVTFPVRETSTRIGNQRLISSKGSFQNPIASSRQHQNCFGLQTLLADLHITPRAGRSIGSIGLAGLVRLSASGTLKTRSSARSGDTQ